jgi:hypothetical protein
MSSHQVIEFDGQSGEAMGPFCFVANPIALTFRIEATECNGDVNSDGTVDVSDVLQVLSNWGLCKGCDEDINQDGDVNVSDLLLLVANWGQCE